MLAVMILLLALVAWAMIIDVIRRYDPTRIARLKADADHQHAAWMRGDMRTAMFGRFP